MSSIVSYLSRTHNNYLQINVPEIESLINDLITDCSQQKKNIELLKNFFNEYKTEITEHIAREEDGIYPYALEIEKAFDEKKISNDLIEQMNKYSITDYVNEHDDIEEKLYDLKNIIIKYLPPTKNPDLCNKILSKLFNLEKDLNDHSRIEEKVMVPKIIKMEKEILSRFKAN